MGEDLRSLRKVANQLLKILLLDGFSTGVSTGSRLEPIELGNEVSVRLCVKFQWSTIAINGPVLIDLDGHNGGTGECLLLSQSTIVVRVAVVEDLRSIRKIVNKQFKLRLIIGRL